MGFLSWIISKVWNAESEAVQKYRKDSEKRKNIREKICVLEAKRQISIQDQDLLNALNYELRILNTGELQEQRKDLNQQKQAMRTLAKREEKVEHESLDKRTKDICELCINWIDAVIRMNGSNYALIWYAPVFTFNETLLRQLIIDLTALERGSSNYSYTTLVQRAQLVRINILELQTSVESSINAYEHMRTALQDQLKAGEHLIREFLSLKRSIKTEETTRLIDKIYLQKLEQRITPLENQEKVIEQQMIVIQQHVGTQITRLRFNILPSIQLTVFNENYWNANSVPPAFFKRVLIAANSCLNLHTKLDPVNQTREQIISKIQTLKNSLSQEHDTFTALKKEIDEKIAA